ncbi:MAG: hypothetical protein IKY64_09280 [Bacteroidaceae bacterium]|nr:hypothetical protein [Bacteroidaceae bacterium]
MQRYRVFSNNTTIYDIISQGTHSDDRKTPHKTPPNTEVRDDNKKKRHPAWDALS